MDMITTAAIRNVFKVRPGFKCAVIVTYVEVYNEEIRDLLRKPHDAANNAGQIEDTWGKKVTPPSLPLRRNADGEIELQGVIEVGVRNGAEISDLVRRGREIRSTFSTDLNSHSSRSHSLLTIRCRSENVVGGVSMHGKLNLVDLAGSERVKRSGVEGDRFEEARRINVSLSALGNVMQGLVKKDKHIPYRDSKLTMLLSDSLGGGNKVLLMLCLREGEKERVETGQTLFFGRRAKRVKLGEAVVRRDAQAEGGDVDADAGSRTPAETREEKAPAMKKVKTIRGRGGAKKE